MAREQWPRRMRARRTQRICAVPPESFLARGLESLLSFVHPTVTEVASEDTKGQS